VGACVLRGAMALSQVQAVGLLAFAVLIMVPPKVAALEGIMSFDFSDFEEIIEQEMDELSNATTEELFGEETIDGNWSDFGPWGDCEGICQEGTRMRFRSCNNPVPDGGAYCEGEAFETQFCLLMNPCPEITIPIEVAFSCADFSTAFEWYFKEGLVEVLKNYVSRDTIEIDLPSCPIGRRRLVAEDEVSTEMTISFDLNPSETEDLLEDPSNLNGTAYAGIEALLSDSETFIPRMEEQAAEYALIDGALAVEVFTNTYDEIVAAFEAGEVTDSTAIVEPTTTGVVIITTTESEDWIEEVVEDAESEGGGSNLKGILFLTFVIGLTTFVITVLFLVSWLERKKCLERDPYDPLVGRT